ncbi:hypothetical protein J6500_12180 [Bradyrhizobium sp. WSM 1704]|uniref:hypothetical protein n=1 Tax=Bradyrhizobium semiaridum TaxID=2821404 RepID=UPI001CE3083F|nr:hypothetical protein [Bradyrhizobium semiaridum]MCA6122645.1 hypothetical protein [Bradyrhizobium semiaridum]
MKSVVILPHYRVDVAGTKGLRRGRGIMLEARGCADTACNRAHGGGTSQREQRREANAKMDRVNLAAHNPFGTDTYGQAVTGR